MGCESTGSTADASALTTLRGGTMTISFQPLTGVGKTKRSVLSDPVATEKRRRVLTKHDEEVGRERTGTMADDLDMTTICFSHYWLFWKYAN